VELFEDRASVTRRVALPGPGRHVVAIEGISPLVSEHALEFAGAVVEEAWVARERISRADADPTLARDLEAICEALRRPARAAEDAARRAEERVARLSTAERSTLAWLPRGLAGDAAEAWLDALRVLGDGRVEAVQASLDRQLDVELRREELRQAEARLDEARVGTATWRARLGLRILVGAGQTELRVRYTIPCALWRPLHRAVLRPPEAGGPWRVAWEVGAMAWNATGEDWTRVALVCSTARPGGFATPPVLTDDLVHPRKREREVVVEAREEVVQVARDGEAAPRATELPGVDDGGEPRTFTAPAPVDLPSDGNPVHVRLEDWESDAQVGWLAHPERSSQFVLRSRQVNLGSRPLLAGPVELLRAGDGGQHAVGRGRVGLVPSGEPFALGWGSHDAVRVTRRADHKADRSLVRGYQTHRFAVTLRVAHLGDEPVTVELRERIPVSEIADVRVTASEVADADGLCTWRLDLAPRATRTLVLNYTVEAPASVRLPW
jgi:uncharacterized protein (TIGR02231 family)